MKRIEFEIAPSVLSKFFPNYRVKTKIQILTILLESIRYSLSYESIKITTAKGKIILIIDKMSRLFFVSEDKAYSIALPFLLTFNDSHIGFSYKGIEIDSYIISNLISVVTQDSFMDGCSLDLSDSLINFETEHENFWLILKELLLYEDGYVRYDHDITGYAEAQKNGCEHRHPLNHLDLFYTSNATFKVGCETRVSIDGFIDVVNTNTDCKYLKNWR